MPESVAEAVTGLALVRRTRGEYADAEALFHEAIAIYEESRRRAGNGADARPVRDRTSYWPGDDERARPLFERSLTLFRRLLDAHGVAFGLYGLAIARPPALNPRRGENAPRASRSFARPATAAMFAKVLVT